MEERWPSAGDKAVSQPPKLTNYSMEQIIQHVAENIPETKFESMKLVCMSGQVLDPVILGEIHTCQQLLWALHKRGVFSKQDFSCLRMLLRAEKLLAKARQLEVHEQKSRSPQRSLAAEPKPVQSSHVLVEENLPTPETSKPALHPALLEIKSFDSKPGTCLQSQESDEVLHHPTQETLRFTGKLVHADAGHDTVPLPSPTKDLLASPLPESLGTTHEFVCQSCHTGATGSSTVAPYTMRQGRGLVLIVNMANFKPHSETSNVRRLKNRIGSERDVDTLSEVFGAFMGFKVEVRENLTSIQLIDFLQEVASRRHIEIDCFICVLMSHGVEDSIFASDCIALPLSEIVQIFKTCKQLQDKPKLFFTQACRGKTKESTRSRMLSESAGEERSSRTSTRSHSEEEKNNTSDRDVLVGFPTTPAGDAFRNEEEGSWYIQTLCNAICDLVPRHEDLQAILTQVNNNVCSFGDGNMQQTPGWRSTLKQRLVFPCPICRDCRCPRHSLSRSPIRSR